MATNDDGVWSLGFRALLRALVKRGFYAKIYAPLGNWSGSSKSIGRAGRIRSYPVELEVFRGYTLDAPPAACVAVGLLSEGGFDAVISGVNHGPNIGLHDLLSSGTIGAALEAALRGLSGVAVSSYCSRYEWGCVKPAAEAGVSALEALVKEAVEGGVIVVVNVPEKPRGVKITSPSPGAPQVESWVRGFEAYLGHKDHGRIYSGEELNIDGGALVKGYITVTVYRVTVNGIEVVRGCSLVERIVESIKQIIR